MPRQSTKTKTTSRPPYAEFRIYPWFDKRLHWHVLVFESCRDMYEYARNEGTGGSDYLGMTRPYLRSRRYDTQRRRWINSPQLGKLFFTRRRMTVEVIAHEAVHAGLHTCRRVGWSLDVQSDAPIANHRTRTGKRFSDEERLACTIGYIANKIARAWRDIERKATSRRQPARQGTRPTARK